MPTAPSPLMRSLPNIIASMFRFLTDLQYTVGSRTDTLKGFFPGLIIFPAFPDDLTVLKSPVLALGSTEYTTFGSPKFGDPGIQAMYRLPIWGFVCGQGSDQKNKAYRDRLMSDLVEIFSTTAANEGFDLYDADTRTVISEVEVTGCSARAIATNAPTIDADRYRFLVEVDVELDGGWA
jgi:hypothetical protein